MNTAAALISILNFGSDILGLLTAFQDTLRREDANRRIGLIREIHEKGQI
jgi:hypothetical protein